MYSAGILPYTIIGGEIYILLGRESYDKTYSDFGGKYDEKDTGIFQTAYREFKEESLYNGFDENILLNLKMIYTESRTLRGHIYYMFLLKLKPESIYEIITNFSNNIKIKRNETYEKDHVRLCKLKDIIDQILNNSSKSISLRKVFRSTILTHQTFFKMFEYFQNIQ
tara:strand:+ start:6417 stop:6917 length:501 start_codon:yes stop_codon:yes gene_type:complete